MQNPKYKIASDLPKELCERCGRSTLDHNQEYCAYAEETYAELRAGRADHALFGTAYVAKYLGLLPDAGTHFHIDQLRDLATNPSLFRKKCKELSILHTQDSRVELPTPFDLGTLGFVFATHAFHATRSALALCERVCLGQSFGLAYVTECRDYARNVRYAYERGRAYQPYLFAYADRGQAQSVVRFLPRTEYSGPCVQTRPLSYAPSTYRRYSYTYSYFDGTYIFRAVTSDREEKTYRVQLAGYMPETNVYHSVYGRRFT